MRNSPHIQTPKVFLEQTGLINMTNHPRAGWDEAFRAMAARGDDKLLDEVSMTKWDASEWNWDEKRP